MSCVLSQSNLSRGLWGWIGISLLAGMPAFAFGEETALEASSLSVVDPLTKRKLGKLSKAEQAILRYTNLARKEHDKPPLTAVSHLTVIAQQHAINMARQQKLEHELDGQSAKDRLKGVEYQFASFGENIAAGYRDEKATVQGWMKSPPHRENLLDETNLGFTQIGIGAHRGTNGVWYCCQVFARPVPGKTYE
jgi:uncharacterized protein YkwD